MIKTCKLIIYFNFNVNTTYIDNKKSLSYQVFIKRYFLILIKKFKTVGTRTLKLIVVRIITFYVLIVTPSNPGFVTMGQKLGKEKLFKYINNFGFGTKTGIDLNGEGSGILFKLDKVGPVELATTSFGQGVSVTPIHLTV